MQIKKYLYIENKIDKIKLNEFELIEQEYTIFIFSIFSIKKKFFTKKKSW